MRCRGKCTVLAARGRFVQLGAEEAHARDRKLIIRGSGRGEQGTAADAGERGGSPCLRGPWERDTRRSPGALRCAYVQV